MWRTVLFSLALVPSQDGYERVVRPLLHRRCVECHGGDAPKAGLDLTGPAGLRAGSDVGPVLVPGDPDASRLWRAVSYTDLELRMPPKGKLADDELAALREWIATGAQLPEGAAPAERASEVARADPLDHWSFRPLADPGVPDVRDGAWPRGDADRFVLARLEQAGLAPAGEADRRTWLRRASAVLVGLPPSPERAAAFLADARPDAYERQVDELLTSPAHAEAWARHWLDLVRYAETRGHEFDYDIPNAWQYRDYVVRAFQADVPYDRFVMEHVAGDLLPPRPNPEGGWDESVLGTGWWWLGEEMHSPVDIRADQTDRNADQLDTFSKAFLGLTVACARCHDHKFDPVGQRDYYALAGFALSGHYRQVRFATREQNAAVARELAELRDARVREVQGELDEGLRAQLARLPGELLAARDRLVGFADRNGHAPLAPDHLADWAAVLRGPALARRDHPLHAWASALAAEREGAGFPAAWRAALAELPSAPAPPPELRVHLDYGPAARTPLLQDGSAFTLLPRGTPLLDGSAPGGVRRLLEVDAAVADPAWDALALAPGTGREAGRLDWVRSGRTLVTPTFRLREGRLAYLVRGRARVWAAVDEHKLLNGPLHNALTTTVDAGGGFRWVRHDLSEYAGHRVHLEFTPDGAPSDFALAQVVEGDAWPDALPWAGPALPAQLADADTPERAAAVLAASLTDLVRRALEGDAAPGELAAANDLLAVLDAPAAGPALLAYRADERAALERLALASPTAPAVLDADGVDELFLPRGDSRAPLDPVPRAWLAAFGGEPRATAEGSGRLQLARALVGPEDPLVARAWVNRVWHHVFGRGIAPSVDDLGHMGEPPTHPELLDHLAYRFTHQQGWSTRALLRELVLSATFRMESSGDPAAEEADPANLLWHRAPVRRLSAEALRDALLAVSGELDLRVGGPSVPLHLTPFLEGRGRPGHSGPLDGDRRRSLYLAVRRNFLTPFLAVFDAPVPSACAGRRAVSNVPAQALALQNDPFVVERARAWARRTLDAGLDGDAARVERMVVEALARPPSADEAAALLAYVELAPDASDEQRLEVWSDLAAVLFNLKEFRYLR